MRPIPGYACAMLALTLLVACDGDDGALDPSARVESVAVVPGIVSLVVGDTLRLTTIARGRMGNPLTGQLATWATASPGVVTVSTDGLVTAVGPGAAMVSATIDAKVGTSTMTVSPKFPAAVFTSVASGGAHTCGLTNGGIASCWGRGEAGQLGVPPPVTTCLSNQDFPCGLVPFPVNGGLSFTQLAGGGAHTCGLTSDGAAWCWGSNTNGQLGDGTLSARSSPVAVATDAKFSQIGAGFDHTCALTSAGAAWCWGMNNVGQLGIGTRTRQLTPVAVNAPTGVTFDQLSPGGPENAGFTCARSTNGDAWCWGSNAQGALGLGTRDFLLHGVPERVSGQLEFATIVTGKGVHVCAVATDGIVYCWGGNRNGALGDGTGTDSFSPLKVSGVTLQQLTVGGYLEGAHTCGLTSSGEAWCWGDNDVGAVGDGTIGGRRLPVAVAGGHRFSMLSAGLRHTCGRRTDGVVYCWGSGRTGQLGTNSTISSALPMRVAGQP
ncbi:MAG TPA: Ig-like domain-containing protein [Gemmatimonadaceae bacterium]|nr:Ig-like domain-containing protein [Gemmatimonadaceae bacterium]